LEDKFKEDIKQLLKDLSKFCNEPTIIINLVNKFQDDNVEDLFLK